MNCESDPRCIIPALGAGDGRPLLGGLYNLSGARPRSEPHDPIAADGGLERSRASPNCEASIDDQDERPQSCRRDLARLRLEVFRRPEPDNLHERLTTIRVTERKIRKKQLIAGWDRGRFTREHPAVPRVPPELASKVGCE